MDIHERLGALGHQLPQLPKPVAKYVPAVRSGSHVFVSGQLPMREGKLVAEGPVASKASVEQAQHAAAQCALNGLAAVDQALEGDWGRLVRIVRLGVFVNSDPDFHEQHLVANGASELIGEAFGEAGVHVRAAVGCPSLPLGASVEIELLAEIGG